MKDKLYEGLTNQERDLLIDQVMKDSIRINSSMELNVSSEQLKPWLSIFAPYLQQNNKKLKTIIEKAYFKQSDLEYFYPTGNSQTSVAEPFNNSPSNDVFRIHFIATTTGVKIYDYASALCKADKGWKDRPNLAIPLMMNKAHKIKVVTLNNTAWILTNQLNDDFVNNTLSLFPYLFELNDLLNDNNVKQCCLAVTKNEPIKQYVESILQNLQAIIAQQHRLDFQKTLNEKIKSEIRNIDYTIKRARENIQNYEESLIDQQNKLDQYLATKLGLESRANISVEEVDGIIDFIKRNKYIQDYEFVDSHSYGTDAKDLVLNIITPITIYETEPLERQINNLSEYDYRADTLKVFRKIFIDEEYQMFCQTYVRINPATTKLTGSKSDNMKNNTDYSKMTQPHIAYYNCWGENKNIILTELRNNELTAAINNIIIALQNINFTDTVVLKNWIDYIHQSQHLMNMPTCLSKADGNFYSIQQILNKIKEKEITTPELEDTLNEF